MKCERCLDPAVWRVWRMDAVVVDACSGCLNDVCIELQRDYEVTKLEVYLIGKAAEWAQIGRALEAIVENR